MLKKHLIVGCFLAVATFAHAQKIGYLDATGTPILDAHESQLRHAVAKRVEGDAIKNYTLKTGTHKGETFYYLAAERFKKGKLYSKVAFPLIEQNGKIIFLSDRRGCLMECIGTNCDMVVKEPCQNIVSVATDEKQQCTTNISF
jgi:hypothetical protein